MGCARPGRGPHREEVVSPLSVLLPEHMEVDDAGVAIMFTTQKLCGRQWSDRELEAMVACSQGRALDRPVCVHGEMLSFKELLFCACCQSQLNLILTERPKRRPKIKTG